MAKKFYTVKMTIESVVLAEDEDNAIENMKNDFEYSDVHYADFDIEETD